MGTCVNCKYAGRPAYKSPCSECKDRNKYESRSEKPKTNGDHIRDMSDEELAQWMLRYQRAIVRETLRVLGTDEHVAAFEEALGEKPDCTDLAKWLKEPVEEVKE